MSTSTEAVGKAHAARPPAPWPSAVYAWYAVAVLVLAHALSIVDRIAIGLLVEPIKADLHVTDTQIGLLQGLAFAIFYTLFGLPMGVLVDRWLRAPLLAIGMLVWSAATMGCGLARSYAMLFLGRIGIGAGEATVMPASSSIIPDLFRPVDRNRAYGVFQVGGSIGTALSYVVGSGAIIMADTVRGWAPAAFGGYSNWQIAFLIMGAPGIPLALLVFFTLREPERRDRLHLTPTRFSFGPIVRQIADNWAAYGVIIGGAVLNTMVVNAQIAWFPTLLIRAHGWTAAQVGGTLGALGFPAGTFSAISAGFVLAWLVKRGRADGPVLVMALQALTWAVFGVIKALHPDMTVVLTAHVLSSLFAIWAVTAALAGLNEITPNEMRGQVIALYTLFSGLIGLTVGPLVVGMLSDDVFTGPKGLQPAMAVMYLVGGALAVLLMVVGRRAFAEAVDRARTWRSES
jgi:MFS family permease